MIQLKIAKLKRYSMGLGPPVCERCLVLYEFKHSYGWECPICKINSPDHLNAWSCGLTDQYLKNNLKFMKFVNGIK